MTEALTDDRLRAMTPTEARRAWLAGATAKERTRIHGLYKGWHGVDLTKVEDEGDVTSDSPAAQGSGDGISLQGLGLALMVIGFAGVFIGWMGDTPKVWLIALGSMGVSAGFFCALFGWIGKKLDLIADRLKA